MKHIIYNSIAVLLSFLLMTTVAAKPNKRPPNHLLGAQSPYLQQHIYNAVDWYPWGKEALEKAKKEDKPIFISVGYSTCHWCHVMARESFDDDAIGAFLNEHFVSIKIDRERRPDLDEQFMLTTEALTGQGGWPNSVFLTADAKPFYAAGYQAKDEFLYTLQQIVELWKTDRPSLEAEGLRISSAIIRFMNRTEAARDVTPEAINQAVGVLTQIVDEFHGGLGVAPKFPQESALMFLMDQAERGSSSSLKIVMDALDGMLKGGIHDHVGGGFHRYSVDAKWLVPHFEKMLYNQALMGQLLVRAYVLSGEERYKQTALRLFDYVLRDMQDPNGGFYSAEDAESYNREGKKSEGAYYIWSQKEFDEILKNHGFLKSVYNTSARGNFKGENILNFAELPHKLAGSLKLSEQGFYEKLNDGLDYIREMRDRRKKPHKDTKILVSWNSLMIEALAHASFVFQEPRYYLSAQRAADYILENMMFETGLKRASYAGSIGTDGQLADYAGLGVSLLSLADYVPHGHVLKKDYIQIAEKLTEEIRLRFGKPFSKDVEAFRSNETADGLGSFPPLDDNPIPSGNALALRLLDGLAKRSGSIDLKQNTQLLSAALSGHALSNPQGRGALAKTVYAVTTSDFGDVRHVAKGNVVVGLQIDRTTSKFTLDLKIKPGWHINSNKPLEDYFIPTKVKVNGVDLNSSGYPKAEVKALGFHKKELSLYEGAFVLKGAFDKSEKGKPHRVDLALQACSDEICLQPEDLTFYFWSK